MMEMPDTETSVPEYRGYFTFTCHVQNLLFSGLTVSSSGAMFGLCVGVALFTFLYEGLKSLRHYLVSILLSFKDDRNRSSVEIEPQRRRKSLFIWIGHLPRRTLRRLKFHILQTLLYMLQLTMGYMVMLIVMSYNGWLVLTIILTTTVCYYLHGFIVSKKPLVVPVEAPVSSL